MVLIWQTPLIIAWRDSSIGHPARGVLPQGGFATMKRWSYEVNAMKTMQIHRFISGLFYIEPRRTLPDPEHVSLAPAQCTLSWNHGSTTPTPHCKTPPLHTSKNGSIWQLFVLCLLANGGHYPQVLFYYSLGHPWKGNSCQMDFCLTSPLLLSWRVLLR